MEDWGSLRLWIAYAAAFSIFGAVLLIARWLKKPKRKAKSSRQKIKKDLSNQYRSRMLLTSNESRFMPIIKRVASRLGLEVSCKVRLGDIAEPKVDLEFYAYKVRQKHIDFVLHTMLGVVVCAIEIDDSSHDSEDAQRRDEEKNIILKSAGIPLIRLRNTAEAELYNTVSKLKDACGR